MPEKRLGLDIRSDGVSAVVVKRGLSSSQVTAAAHAAVSGDGGVEDALAEVLDALEARADLETMGISAGFSDAPMNFRAVHLPFAEMKKARQILPVELETQAPLKAEDIVADIHVLSRDEGLSGIAAYSSGSEVERELNILSAHGLSADHLCVPQVSAAFAFLSHRDDLPRKGLVLSASLRSACLVIFEDERPVFVRRIEGPFGRELARLSSQILLSVRAVSEMLCEDFVPEALYLTGSALERADFAGALSARTGIAVTPVNLSEETGTTVSDDAAEDFSPHLMDAALSLALFPPTDSAGFNLRQGAYAVTRRWERFRAELYHAGVLGLCLFLILLFNFLAGTRVLSREARRIAAQNAALVAAVLPGEQPGSDPVKALSDKVAALKGVSGVPEEEAVPARMVDILKTVTEKIGKDAGLTLSQMTVSSEGVQIGGEAESISAVDAVQGRLEKTPPFDKVTIVSTDNDKRTGKVNFRLKCQFTAPPGGGEGPKPAEGEPS